LQKQETGLPDVTGYLLVGGTEGGLRQVAGVGTGDRFGVELFGYEDAQEVAGVGQGLRGRQGQSGRLCRTPNSALAVCVFCGSIWRVILRC
jgi:hypothetical protein